MPTFEVWGPSGFPYLKMVKIMTVLVDLHGKKSNKKDKLDVQKHHAERCLCIDILGIGIRLTIVTTVILVI